MKYLVYLLIVAFFQIPVFGQNMDIVWQQCFGGSMLDGANDMVMVENGYLIAGGTGSNDYDISISYGNGDGWLVRVDSLGNMLWEKTYGGSDSEAFNRIIPTSDNNFYLLGLSFSSDGDISSDPYPDSPDYWIVKIDSAGTILWDKIVGGNQGEVLFTGAPTFDGGVVALGWTYSNDGDVSVNYGGADTWMVKLSSEGELEWDFTIGTDWIDKGQAVLQTSDGGYLIESSSMLGEGGNISCTPHSYMTEAVLTKLDSDRNIEWQHCYGGSDSDAFGSILETNNGYLLSGYTRSNDGDVMGWHGESDVWVVNIDYDGNIVWQNALGGSNYEEAINIAETDENNIGIIGMTQSNNGDVSGNHTLSEYDYDIWMIKLNSDGELISQQCFGGEGSEAVEFGVVKKSDNNFVIAGRTDFGPSYDVGCTPHGGNYYDKDWWVFEIKDCTQYPVGNIGAMNGPDTVCTVYDSTNIYTIDPVTGAWYYEWYLSGAAGVINSNGPEAMVNWASGWEGTATIMVRAMNDCDTTEWSEPFNTEVFTCLGVEELQAGNVKMRVYPNPAREFVVFEFSVADRNADNGTAAGKLGDSSHTFGMTGDEGMISNGSNSKGVSHASAKSRAQGFDMTAREGAEVVIVDVYGQRVAELPISSGKTVWDCRDVKNGIYYYRVEVDGEVLSGKLIVQK